VSAPDGLDAPERAQLSKEDLVLAGLVGAYADRRDRGLPPRAHELLACAAELGDGATARLRTVLALYEALRADEDSPA
jgi:hypothetical protein